MNSDKDSRKTAVVLLSGGLDSATVLAWAISQGYVCYAMSVRYGQRSTTELNAASELAKTLGVAEHRIFDLNLASFGGSALTDHNIAVPESQHVNAQSLADDDIPVTYVPARNTLFLSLALAWAEVLGANDLFIGVNSVDYSGYPDCRPEFIHAFETMANLATKAGVLGDVPLKIHTPLMKKSKAEIIQLGTSLGLDYALSVSCYQADDAGRACGRCDSCQLRAEGFAAAGLADPTRYQQ